MAIVTENRAGPFGRRGAWLGEQRRSRRWRRFLGARNHPRQVITAARADPHHGQPSPTCIDVREPKLKLPQGVRAPSSAPVLSCSTMVGARTPSSKVSRPDQSVYPLSGGEAGETEDLAASHPRYHRFIRGKTSRISSHAAPHGPPRSRRLRKWRATTGSGRSLVAIHRDGDVGVTVVTVSTRPDRTAGTRKHTRASSGAGSRRQR